MLLNINKSNSIAVNKSNPTSPIENGVDSNENSSSALDQAMAATLAAIEVPETQDKSGRLNCFLLR